MLAFGCSLWLAFAGPLAQSPAQKAVEDKAKGPTVKQLLELEPAVARAFRHAIIKFSLRGEQYVYEYDGIWDKSIEPSVVHQVYGGEFTLVRLFRYFKEYKKPLRVDVRKVYEEFPAYRDKQAGDCKGKTLVSGDVWAVQRHGRRAYVVVAVRLKSLGEDCKILPQLNKQPYGVVFAEFDYKAGGVIRSRLFKTVKAKKSKKAGK